MDSSFKSPFIGSIDQGTSSTRFMIFDYFGKIVVKKQIEVQSDTPFVGWFEQDLDMLWHGVKSCMENGLTEFKQKGYSLSDIKAVGIANQRETVACWDKNTGTPLSKAIVWNDLRTQELAELYKEKYENLGLQNITGLKMSTYFSALKIRYLLDNNNAVKAAYICDSLKVGTIDTWLVHKLAEECGSEAFITDVTNASRTMLMDIHTLEWSQTMLSFFDIKLSVLPKIVSSAEIYFSLNCFGLNNVPLAGCIGDQQAAMIGQKCFYPGLAKTTYGTGCFILFNTGETPYISKNQLITTVAFQFGRGKPSYALEGSVAVAGSGLRWLKDVGMIKNYNDIDRIAGKVKDTGDVYFVTAFSGLFAPYWEPDARGCLVGLTHYVNKGHIVRAALEATCFQIKAITNAMNVDSKKPLKKIKASGGNTKSDVLMQLQADILGINIERPNILEQSAFGAAMAAGMAVGVWKSFKELENLNVEQVQIFRPTIGDTERNKKYSRWNEAVIKSFGWVKM